MSRRTAADIEADIEVHRQLYELSRRLAFQYMDRTGWSVRGLASKLGEHRESVTRFLNATPGSEPCSSRPEKIRVLNKVLRLCDTWDHIEQVEIETEPDSDCFDALFRNHRRRLRRLRDRNCFESHHALALIPESVAAALVSPRYRDRMCANTLLSLASILGPPGFGKAGRLGKTEPVHEAMESVDRLEWVGLCSVLPEHRELMPQRISGYAGMARANGGLHLRSDDLVRRGLFGSLAAARVQRTVEDGLWANVLNLLDHLLACRWGRARKWSVEVAQVASENLSDGFRHAWATLSIECVRSHWKSLRIRSVLPHAGEVMP